MSRHAPQQGSSFSEQNVQTPGYILDAVERKFGKLAVDLAALPHNTACTRFIAPAEDSLLVDWTRRLEGGIGWLNPPFSDIRPWAMKCAEESRKGARIVMLTPASISSKWFREHVGPVATLVLGVYPKFAFVGSESVGVYPKDLMIASYNCGGKRGFYSWDWRPEGWNSKSAASYVRAKASPEARI